MWGVRRGGSDGCVLVGCVSDPWAREMLMTVATQRKWSSHCLVLFIYLHMYLKDYFILCVQVFCLCVYVCI